MRIICYSVLVVLLFAFPVAAGEMKGGDTPSTYDVKDEWYSPEWLGTAPYAPIFEMRDTVNKYGRYATLTKTITIKDIIKFHGHFCGGLVESASALKVAFDKMFPDKAIDRTDLRIVSNNSACGGDVASYLTGARLGFGTHHIDNSLTESEFIVQKVSTGEAIHVKLNPAVYPTEVKTQMKKLESGEFTPRDIDLFQESFIINEIKSYEWPEPLCNDLGKRRDNDFRSVPLK